MKIFISYHRADTKYRREIEKIIKMNGIDCYAVPEDIDFNGKSPQTIKNFLCHRVKECDVVVCLIGCEAYSRPHVDHEIHSALKGAVGKRQGIVGLVLETRNEQLDNINLNTFPTKLWDNKDYVVWSKYEEAKSTIIALINKAYVNANDATKVTNHTNPCMQLRSTLYYDN